MNYAEARCLKSKGGWHWTIQHGSDGFVSVGECCAEHKDKPHKTKEEAEKCHYDHAISKAQTMRSSSWKTCRESGEPTKDLLAVGEEGARAFIPLCEKFHIDKEVIAKHYKMPEKVTYS